MKCTASFFRGHRWSKWRKMYGSPETGDDKCIYRRELQKRRCSRCGYTETVWSNAVMILKPKEKMDCATSSE